MGSGVGSVRAGFAVSHLEAHPPRAGGCPSRARVPLEPAAFKPLPGLLCGPSWSGCRCRPQPDRARAASLAVLSRHFTPAAGSLYRRGRAPFLPPVQVRGCQLENAVDGVPLGRNGVAGPYLALFPPPMRPYRAIERAEIGRQRGNALSGIEAPAAPAAASIPEPS